MFDKLTDERGNLTLGTKFGMVGLAIAVFIGLAALVSAVYVVGAGERGVIFSQQSGTEERTYDEGWHLKKPFIEEAYQYNVKRQKLTVEADGMSDDVQRSIITVTVHFKIDAKDAWWIHKNVGRDYKQIVVKPGIQQSVKATISQYEAAELIKKRDELPSVISDKLSPKLQEIRVDLVAVDIENIDFSDEFEQAVEAKVVAEQEAEKQKRLEIAAQHEANQSVIRAKGEAKAIRVLNEQLGKSRGYLTYYAIQNWNGILPKTYVQGSAGANGTGGIADILVPAPSDGGMGDAVDWNPNAGIKTNASVEG